MLATPSKDNMEICELQKSPTTLSVLFWNLMKKDLASYVAQLVIDEQIDFVALAESTCDEDDLIERSSLGTKNYAYTLGLSKLTIFTSLNYGTVLPILDDARLAVRAINFDSGLEILIAATHIVDKVNNEDVDQAACAREVAEKIRQIETDRKHQNTILVGDLNMNPYEYGVVGADTLHAVSDLRIAQKRRTRKSGGKEYPLFYNPMWNFFGDRRNELPGSYYFNNSGRHFNLFWHIVDQVLFRPDLFRNFELVDLNIVTTIGETSLLCKNCRPNKGVFSDHLPLVFRLVRKEVLL